MEEILMNSLLVFCIVLTISIVCVFGYLIKFTKKQTILWSTLLLSFISTAVADSTNSLIIKSLFTLSGLALMIVSVCCCFKIHKERKMKNGGMNNE